ncbi:MAG: GAF domain-containing protein, partial [Gaiellaceae bacterium]
MTVDTQPLAALPGLRGLLEVSRLVRDERDLTRLVDAIAATIADSLGFRTVSINLQRAAEGDFVVTTVHGSEDARDALLGTTREPDAWNLCFVERFLRRGAYLIPCGEGDWGSVTSHVPDLELSSDPDAWHPEDALLVPMRAPDGTLLGVVSVDEPESGLRPTDEEIDVLVAFAQHVADAIETVQAAAAAARDRVALARLLEVSASLVDLDSVDLVLAAVARGIQDALAFEKVVVCLATEDGGFVPAGMAGWEADASDLEFTISSSDLDALFVPEFETEGCYLVDHETASALVTTGSQYRSQRNGKGPSAWNRHWLVVPLIERDGARSGYIWVEDPEDCLLPSRERLQALRTFANQATMAIRAAVDTATLNARNSELAALHDTAVALLERRDVDGVLTEIVQSACALVGTPHGYLALVDHETDQLRTAVKLGLLEDLGPGTAGRGEGAAGRVWENNETLSIDNYADWNGRADGFARAQFHATVAVPLRAQGEVTGVLGLANAEPGRTFGAAQIALVERFAQLAALALENARLNAALGHSEELYRRIVDCSTDLISLVDREGSTVVISPSVYPTLGYHPHEMVGNGFAALVHPDDVPTAEAMFGNALDGLHAAATVRVRHADGSWVLLEALASAIASPDGGRPTHILATGRDITERQRLEDQLRQAQKMESIGRLAGGIAHDFNNLLTAISGYAELTLMDFDAGAPPLRDNTEQIARAAGRAAALTGQLLAFSRKQVLRPQVIDLNEIVEGVAPMLSRMLGEDVVLSTALDSELGTTLADPTQIEQVVLNL